MDRRKLFVQTVDWLAEAGDRQPPNEHELLLASGRIRLLLLDKTRLVDQVNASYRFDIRYRIVRSGPPPGAVFRSIMDGLSPSHMLPISRPIESVGLEAFLHERVMLN
jgi:hypothetical protein